MSEPKPLSRKEQDLQVQIAVAHAEEGDPWAMLLHLQEANVLTGVRRVFRRRWPRLPEEEIDDILGRGVDALFRKLSGGSTVANPIGYLLEVMTHEAYDYCRENSRIVRLDPERDRADHPSGRSGRDLRMQAAIRIARDLLPRLGEQSVQSVMGYIFDAVEAGQERVTTTEIAEAAGISEEAARQCRSRGFRRLERLAHEEGLAKPLHLDGVSESRLAQDGLGIV